MFRLKLKEMWKIRWILRKFSFLTLYNDFFDFFDDTTLQRYIRNPPL